MARGYYDNIESRCTGRRFTIGLIRTVWKFSTELWQHRNAALKNEIQPLELKRQEKELDEIISDHYARGPTGLIRRMHFKFKRRLITILLRHVPLERALLASVVAARKLAQVTKVTTNPLSSKKRQCNAGCADPQTTLDRAASTPSNENAYFQKHNDDNTPANGKTSKGGQRADKHITPTKTKSRQTLVYPLQAQRQQ